MNIAAIDQKKLKALVHQIRTLNTIPPKLRRELADEIMRQADIIKRTDFEHLMCQHHAQILSGYKSRESIVRLGRQGLITVYSPCHDGYGTLYDRREIEKIALKEKRMGKQKRVRSDYVVRS